MWFPDRGPYKPTPVTSDRISRVFGATDDRIIALVDGCFTLVDPVGFSVEQDRLRAAYAEAYAGYFADNLPDNGVPCRFTVHLTDVPDKAASYEFYATALLQRSLQVNSR